MRARPLQALIKQAPQNKESIIHYIIKKKRNALDNRGGGNFYIIRVREKILIVVKHRHRNTNILGSKIRLQWVE